MVTEEDLLIQDERLDELACRMLEYPQPDEGLVHTFTPGLYLRQKTMEAGTMWVSARHKTRHQFIVSEGVVSVWSEKKGVELISAPYHGITEPGTQRLLFVHSRTIWTTAHATDKTTVEAVEEDILEKSPRVIEFLKQKEIH